MAVVQFLAVRSFSQLHKVETGSGFTQPLIQWVPEVKRPGHEADSSPSSNAEVKNDGAITLLPHTS
jgi:hypothetical protein